MNERTLANKFRPQKYIDVVGQESEIDVLKKIVEGVWKPPALLFTGPFGTGKTTLARLTAKALLCGSRVGPEPCGICMSCVYMDKENHPGYTEMDAASRGKVADVREIKDLLEYRATGELRIINFDEAHMLTPEAQNAMLQMLEEGRQGVILAFCTTETGKMLPTIRSRCIELGLKLLTAQQIGDRLRMVIEKENKKVDDKAIRIISTYVRGHLRDAMMLTEQLLSMEEEVTEALTRSYLRLDKYVDVYEFLVMRDKKQQFTKLEDLLCNYSAQELQEIVGQTLLNAYKAKLGIGDFSQVDEGWLKRIESLYGDTLLKKAEQVLSLEADFATINHATATFAKIFVDETAPVEDRTGGDDRGSVLHSFRKPKVAS